jgi:hypothetical protein
MAFLQFLSQKQPYFKGKRETKFHVYIWQNGREESRYTHSLGFKTATEPFGRAYEPCGFTISIDLGIPVGCLTLLMSKFGSPFVGQCWMKCPKQKWEEKVSYTDWHWYPAFYKQMGRLLNLEILTYQAPCICDIHSLVEVFSAPNLADPDK